YRMKGIGYKSDNDKKIVLQTVGSRVDLEYGDYWEEGEEKTNVLVFIGKKLDQLNIETLLNQMLKNPTFEKK
ncbi:MAG: GTP-binding protein, partial [Sphingobacterium sp.]